MSDLDVLEDVDGWVSEGQGVALATVVNVKRSAPRPPGAKIADSEAWDVGLPCGGEIDVWVERYEP
jgi:xanthine dehydrogenase accessory factor